MRGRSGSRRWPWRGPASGGSASARQPAWATPTRHASARSRSSRALARVAAPPASPPSIWASSTMRPSRSSCSISGHRPAVAFALGDPEMGIGVGGDLRQVGDAQDLVAPGERPQASADRVGAATADPRIDLVEDEDGRGVRLGDDPLDGQGDARQLAAGRDARERPGRLAGVRGEAIDDLVGADGVEGDRVAVDLDGGFVVGPPDGARGRPRRRRPGTRARPVPRRRPPREPSPRSGARRTGRSRRPRLPRAGAASSRSRRARSSSRPRSRSSSGAARSPWAMTSASSSP